jgi:hypothetical protein
VLHSFIPHAAFGVELLLLLLLLLLLAHPAGDGLPGECCIQPGCAGAGHSYRRAGVLEDHQEQQGAQV